MFNCTETGMYKIDALIKAYEPCQLIFEFQEKSVVTNIKATKGEFKYQTLGNIEISETGNFILELHPVQDDWKELELARVDLVKQ